MTFVTFYWCCYFVGHLDKTVVHGRIVLVILRRLYDNALLYGLVGRVKGDCSLITSLVWANYGILFVIYT